MALTKSGQPAPEEPRCIEEAEHPVLMLDFLSRDGRIHGFPYSQLVNYLLDPNPEVQRTKDAPPERLTFSFSTHDVVVTGWRLIALRPLLQSAKLAALCAANPRYANVARTKPFVAQIVVKPLGTVP